MTTTAPEKTSTPKTAPKGETPPAKQPTALEKYFELASRLRSIRQQHEAAVRLVDDLHQMTSDHRKEIATRAQLLVEGKPLPTDEGPDLRQRIRKAQTDVEVFAKAVELAQEETQKAAVMATREASKAAQPKHRSAIAKIVQALSDLIAANKEEQAVRASVESVVGGIGTCALQPSFFAPVGEILDVSSPVSHYLAGLVDSGDITVDSHELVREMWRVQSRRLPGRLTPPSVPSRDVFPIGELAHGAGVYRVPDGTKSQPGDFPRDPLKF